MSADAGIDVLVVGAGPTGLMLANQLARRGVRVAIIDRHGGPAQQTRAIAVHARTLEIFAWLGVAEPAIALGRKGDGVNLWMRGKRVARLPFGDIGRGQSRFPYVLMLGQDDNEHIVGARLREQGVDVWWSTELVAFAQRDRGVVATLRRSDGTSATMTASWLAGCDGAKSAVRELSRIGFPGAPYEQVFFVADTVATGAMVPDELNVYLSEGGFHLFFPMRGTDRWRVIGILPAALTGRDDLAFDEVVPHIRREAGADLAFAQCLWFSTYRIHHRCAERFRDRRAFLLGDAAHVHSPAGGQGMNTGLQDAFNLAWKLASVIVDGADDTLLDTYAEERMPVAHRLLRTTDRAFMLAVSGSPLARVARARVVARVAAFALRFSFVRQFAFRTVSQIGIGYPDSRLSRKHGRLAGGAPHAGDRFPWLEVREREGAPPKDFYARLDDTRFNFVAIGQPPPTLPPSLDGRVLVHSLAAGANAAELARVRLPAPSAWLLRPDVHVGLVGVRLDARAVTEYLVRWRLVPEAASGLHS
ncbi:MAG: FAD-dependent oxidoreductase [Betaproteobacteria bacterium]